MQNSDVELEGPVLDTETGMRSYTVRGPRGETSFGIVPVVDDGVVRWIMRPGTSVAEPTDPGFEPY